MTVESDTPNQAMTSTYCVNPMEGHNVGHQTLDKLYIGCIVSANNHIHIWASGFLDPLCSVLSQNQSLSCCSGKGGTLVGVPKYTVQRMREWSASKAGLRPENRVQCAVHTAIIRNQK